MRIVLQLNKLGSIATVCSLHWISQPVVQSRVPMWLISPVQLWSDLTQLIQQMAEKQVSTGSKRRRLKCSLAKSFPQTNKWEETGGSLVGPFGSFSPGINCQRCSGPATGAVSGHPDTVEWRTKPKGLKELAGRDVSLEIHRGVKRLHGIFLDMEDLMLTGKDWWTTSLRLEAAGVGISGELTRVTSGGRVQTNRITKF